MEVVLIAWRTRERERERERGRWKEGEMARALVQTRVGEAEGALQLVTREKPCPPSPEHVLVRMTLRPIHPHDIMFMRTGRLLHQLGGSHYPILGSEGFGIVEEVGNGVTKFKPGQRVIPLVWMEYMETGNGSWQEYLVLPEARIVACPDGISDETAAQFFTNPCTVYGLLDDLAAPKGEYILQTAAASVLGRQLIQLAKHWGLKTISVVRRDTYKDELIALGADYVINSETEDVVQLVKEITSGKGAYGAFDAVGGSLTKVVGASVRDGGRVFVYGFLSGWDITQSILDMMRGVQVTFWMLPKYLNTAERQARVYAEVLKLLQEKVIAPHSGKTFQLEDFVAAIQESQKESRGGKVLLRS